MASMVVVERTISTSKSAANTTSGVYLNGTGVGAVSIGDTTGSVINGAATAAASVDGNESISSSCSPEQEDEAASPQGQDNFDINLADNTGSIENNFQEFPNEPG
ncbi:unnamed protein product [Dibothriocephalus latus]|uniref:Uncharacterized protein n=1 Tax=Dibothriocephalus latus TaxID=60516 RepID=A0A3P6SEP9_DIBLA|nr:unnamed protein product [Dibothriocephalus latus]